MVQKVTTMESVQLITNLAEMISEVDVEKQCAYIASWLKQHIPVDGIGFLLNEPSLRLFHLHTQDIPRDVFKVLEDVFPTSGQSKDGRNEVVFLPLEEGEVVVSDHQKDPQSSELIMLGIPLRVRQSSFGILAIVTTWETGQHLTNGKTAPPWFTPLISSLLFNTISQQQNAERIRFLRLYQTVSSALGYVGDLQELLTTIVSIVTSELPSEEGSVLLLDEESNEFEFFTAVGETGAELVKVRFPAEKGIAGRALRERKTLVVNDVQNSPDFYGSIDEEHDFKTQSILATPLLSGDEAIGVIEAINKIGKDGFDEEDKRILTAIADEVALAIKNARLFDYVVDSYCKIRQGQHSCKGCKRPLKSWTPCAVQIGKV